MRGGELRKAWEEKYPFFAGKEWSTTGQAQYNAIIGGGRGFA